MLILRLCAVPDYYNFLDAADTPSLSVSEVIRLKHVAKVFIRNIGSSPMSIGELLICCPHAVHMLLPCPQVMLLPFAVSEAIRYRHIAQSAITDMTLVSDPHILEPFASMNSINDCPEDFATIDSLAKENDVHIPQLHQALAKALGASVGVVNCCSTFEVDSRNVVNSHNTETIGHLKPDIVVIDKRYEPVDTFRCLTMSAAHESLAKGLDLGIVQPELAYLGLCLLLFASASCA